MFERFAPAQRPQEVPMGGNVTKDFPRSGPRILPQGPADGLLQKEFIRCERRFYATVQQVQIGILFERKLAENGAAALP
jgi:hypothetical protein